MNIEVFNSNDINRIIGDSTDMTLAYNVTVAQQKNIIKGTFKNKDNESFYGICVAVVNNYFSVFGRKHFMFYQCWKCPLALVDMHCYDWIDSKNPKSVLVALKRFEWRIKHWRF